MAEETTLTVRPARQGEDVAADLLLEDVPEADVSSREWFRGAVPGADRSPWKATRTKVGMD